MVFERQETRLKVMPDPRLRAGVCTALEYICERHGLNKQEQRELAIAVVRRCEALENQNGRCCEVVIDEREDRIEVSVGPAAEACASEALARETSVAYARDKAPAKQTFVKHFHRNPTHF